MCIGEKREKNKYQEIKEKGVADEGQTNGH